MHKLKELEITLETALETGDIAAARCAWKEYKTTRAAMYKEHIDGIRNQIPTGVAAMMKVIASAVINAVVQVEQEKASQN